MESQWTKNGNKWVLYRCWEDNPGGIPTIWARFVDHWNEKLQVTRGWPVGTRDGAVLRQKDALPGSIGRTRLPRAHDRGEARPSPECNKR